MNESWHQEDGWASLGLAMMPPAELAQVAAVQEEMGSILPSAVPEEWIHSTYLPWVARMCFGSDSLSMIATYVYAGGAQQTSSTTSYYD